MPNKKEWTIFDFESKEWVSVGKKQFEDMTSKRAEECRKSIQDGTTLRFDSAKEAIEYLNAE